MVFIGNEYVISISVLISVLSFSFAIFTGIVNIKRNKSHDDKKDATNITTVIVRLDNIMEILSDLKEEISTIKTETKSDSKEYRERISKVEESAKQAHRRLDELIKTLK